ncbi:MAG: DUF1801 domain-containing protein [Dokdonella sp.]
MKSNKTQETNEDVSNYFDGIERVARRDDCLALAALMAKATRHSARMWGPGIVGFGVHKYQYASGRTGEICAVGFASRKTEIALYGLDVVLESNGLLSRLGKYKATKGCLYVKHLADVDLKVLTLMIQAAADVRISRDA